MTEIVEHNDLKLHNCYVQELPKPPSHHDKVSEIVGYRDVVFHVPTMTRGASMDEIADMAARHYIEKRGHPGRDRLLKISIVPVSTLTDVNHMAVFLRLCD